MVPAATCEAVGVALVLEAGVVVVVGLVLAASLPRPTSSASPWYPYVAADSRVVVPGEEATGARSPAQGEAEEMRRRSGTTTTRRRPAAQSMASGGAARRGEARRGGVVVVGWRACAWRGEGERPRDGYMGGIFCFQNFKLQYFLIFMWIK